jgi:tol-pal system protein YbgF
MTIRTLLSRAALAATLIATMPAFADTPARLRHDLDDAAARLADMKRATALLPAQLSNDAALRFEERIRELEREIRNLTSRVEDLAHQQREQARENERFRNDVDFRLGQIEKGARAAPPAKPGPGKPGRGDDNDEEKPRGGDAGAKADYDTAIGLLRRADYKAAEAALSQFLKRHPNDAQAPNAHYWLGETYLALNRPADAAFQYADVVKKFPKHPKAQDSLYKLGVAMAKQGKKAEACAALGEYGRRHPNGALKREVDIESRRLACG